jgi:branched-chain amino acid transport system permease protein
MKHRLALGLMLVTLLLVAPLLSGTFERHLMIIVGIHVILVLGLDLLVGWVGLLSMAQAAFWGIGAYASALLSLKFQFPFWLALAGASATSASAGLIIGYPLLRLRDYQFLVGTFVAGIALTTVFTNLVSITGGPSGLTGIPFADVGIPGLVTHQINPMRAKAEYLYLVLALVALTWFVHWTITRRNWIGHVLAGIRENAALSQAVGIPTGRYKLLAFCVSAAFAGVAGSLYAHYVTFINPELFTFVESFDLLVMTIVGGAGSSSGPLVGSVLLTAIRELTHPLHPAIAQILFGVLLIGITALLPGGFVGGATKLKAWIQNSRL